MARYTPEKAAAAIQDWWKYWSWQRSIRLDEDPPCMCEWCVCYPDGWGGDWEEERAASRIQDWWGQRKGTLLSARLNALPRDLTMVESSGSIVQWSEEALVW